MVIIISTRHFALNVSYLDQMGQNSVKYNSKPNINQICIPKIILYKFGNKIEIKKQNKNEARLDVGRVSLWPIILGIFCYIYYNTNLFTHFN